MSDVGALDSGATFSISRRRVSGRDALRVNGDWLATRLIMLEAALRCRMSDQQGALRCLKRLSDCPFEDLSRFICPELSLPNVPEKSISYRTADKEENLGRLSVTSSQRWGSSPGHKIALTRTQRAVLRHVASGAANTEIARRMDVSVNTVKWHLKQVFQRLEVSNRCAAVFAARLCGLL
ncbi:helix-turn-helix transcriptional regulator [Spectribacter hydrogenooxidans]|uniref:LuxR C-terminal-related transcriptional regulator n=1 Tax=Spectribacter hydrogenoxidans TaxID=3075608 RepID=A0ABU3C495_9GAMM|nr:LuxR C-terminal-related transcriptional regulator [Salinisphaera sp. W335]MDT0636337.1 LuxR C-terminal-related transcriptional regulator [Salinisphaera sp. W335]